MNEGWSGEEYLVLFSEDESKVKTQQYKLDEFLPGYHLFGIKSWDDFIVINKFNKVFTVPTVPMVIPFLESYILPKSLSLTHDKKFTGKIKWYTQPIVFGGDPNIGENLVWVSHDQHIPLVNFWNTKYNEANKN